MQKERTFAVIGGDTRQIYAAERLRQAGFRVSVFGFDDPEKRKDLSPAGSLAEALDSDCILLPLPVSKNGRTLNASYADNEIPLRAITGNLPAGRSVFLGMGSEAFIRELTGAGAGVFDYFQREELTVKNALLTAEGLLWTALDRLPVAVSGLPVGITGYGRVGFFTAKLFHALGANVTVFARDPVQRVKAQTAGMNARPLHELSDGIGGLACLINTIPSPVVSADLIARSDGGCLFIEAASAPYGIDFAACAEHRRTLVKAFSLPGKTSPKSAGIMIADTVIDMVKEEM